MPIGICLVAGPATRYTLFYDPCRLLRTQFRNGAAVGDIRYGQHQTTAAFAAVYREARILRIQRAWPPDESSIFGHESVVLLPSS